MPRLGIRRLCLLLEYAQQALAEEITSKFRLLSVLLCSRLEHVWLLCLSRAPYYACHQMYAASNLAAMCLPVE